METGGAVPPSRVLAVPEQGGVGAASSVTEGKSAGFVRRELRSLLFYLQSR